MAATRGSPVNPSYRVSTPGAGVGSFSGGKGNGAGGRNPQAAGSVVEVPLWEARPQGLRVAIFLPRFRLGRFVLPGELPSQILVVLRR